MASTSSNYVAFEPTPMITENQEPSHPQARASWIARLTFSWVKPLMTLGNSKQLSDDDLNVLQLHHQASVVSEQFDLAFNKSKSLPRVFLQMFGWRFMFSGLGLAFGAATSFVGPVVLNHVVSTLSLGEYDVIDLSVWIGVLFALLVLQTVVDNYAQFVLEVIAIQFSTAINAMIYRKSMRLDAEARKEKPTGDITNMMTSDSRMIAASAAFAHMLWIVPIQLTVVSVMLYRLLGSASLAGFGVILVVLILNGIVSFGVFRLYTTFMKRKDARMAVITEVFKSISIVKFNAWEDHFRARIAGVRRAEVATVWRFLQLSAGSIVLTWGGPVFISAAVFSVYVGVLGHPLTPAIVFTSIALFQLVQSQLQALPIVIGACVMAAVGARRINAFFALPELDASYDQQQDVDKDIASDVIVSIEHATFSWGGTDSPLLQDVNLTVHEGDFVVVHGPVGCGKSSLCMALLGEMTKTHGHVFVGANVAYCAQKPWIQHATVRDNILFGRPYDRSKYEQVMDACALTHDMKSLPAGDFTEIGERGINLSGGQKARVALARACYSDASVYILDAPLSAVDAIVQNEMIQKCLLGLLRHRTIILVTHHPELIASTHVTCAITIREDGSIFDTRRMVARESGMVDKRLDGTRQVDPMAVDGVDSAVDVIGVMENLSPVHHSHAFRDSTFQVVTENRPSSNEHGRLVDDEERKEGRVGFRVFKAYYNAVGGLPVVLLLVVAQVLWQALLITSDIWLKDWSADAFDDTDQYSSTYRRDVYTILGLLSACMVMARTWIVSYVGLRASRRLFDRMTDALLSAPMKFYDANPIGRILQRYVGDVSDVDIAVPTTFGNFFASLFSVGCSLATTAFIIRFYGVLLLPIVVMYIVLGKFYLQPAREIERVFRTAEAPILSHLSETVEGASTIRAFGATHFTRFQRTNYSKLDRASQAWFARAAISRWFGLRIQLLGSVLVFVVASALLLLHNHLSSAIVGLAFTYVLKVSSSMEQIVSSWSDVETTMVSPERLQQFAEVEPEAPHHVSVVDPGLPSTWPSSGTLHFDNVSFRYKDASRMVLEDVSFTVGSGEKIGIVGRTGAGKSSLTMALFRINEVANGSICIDGVDVSKIGLHTLRANLSIIPQNPLLFKGSLRNNIDPLDHYEDAQIWDAIRLVGLYERISSDEQKLASAVDENGENFSVGERQMLCMARALLRQSRIVIFDEATAAIDHETDQKLQRVIREAFKASTVLTIAHRLDTILDSDRILVLDNGHVVEFASPAELVKKGDGHFFDLMQEGGYMDTFLANHNQGLGTQ